MTKIVDGLGMSGTRWQAFLAGMGTAAALFYIGKRLVRTYEEQVATVTFERAKTLRRRANGITRDVDRGGSAS